MARVKEGERVYAALSAGKGKVRLFGSGTYEGMQKPDVTLMGVAPGEVPGFVNPKIKLDNGDVVWGAECWWGPESGLEEFVAGREVEIVDTKEFRK